MSKDITPAPQFSDLGLSNQLIKALDDVGYETPSQIQAEVIPHVLSGVDVIGEAQTGTGKTAAFALPLLSTIDIANPNPQVLVLAPTRELAIQVSEAFQRYASYMKGFHVVPIYGGQSYTLQIKQLKRGVQVVVGTPGRLMDHMRRGTLKLDDLKCIVLDEADEMLRMGFIDDVEWVLAQAPEQRQIALFSATMPKEIRKMAQRYLHNPAEVKIKVKTATAETINQRYWIVSGVHKLDALTRILEGEAFDAVIVFVRTKTATVELAEKLEARGYAAASLNGDIAQAQRERTVSQLKAGKLDILVATDVAARGLDVPRISHVINYDIPYDTEAYVHRIGRTGRAGREGEAILFVAPRERRMLRSIERATRKQIEPMRLPSSEDINDKRIVRFKQQITDVLGAEDLAFYQRLLEQYEQEHNVAPLDIAAALAKLLQGDTPFLLQKKPEKVHVDGASRDGRPRDRNKQGSKSVRQRKGFSSDEGMAQYRIEVGDDDNVKPGNIVGAIANEAGLSSRDIGRIETYDDFSIVSLPEGLPQQVLRDLENVWVVGRQLKISRVDDAPIRKRSRPKKLATKDSRKKKPRHR